MKTKFIKVSVSERLPKEERLYPVIFNLAGETIIETVNYEHELGFYAENVDCSLIEEYLLEVPDREDEIRELLEWKESALKIMNNIDLQKVGKLINAPLGSDVSTHILPFVENSLNKEKQMRETIEIYKECFAEFIPLEKYDEATEFLSTANNGLAKYLSKKEK